MWLRIHLASLGAGAGAMAIFTFLIFSLAYLLFVSHDRLHLRFLLLQAVFLPYLTGYAFYTSGTELWWVLLWYRICVTGLILTPLALEFFLGALLERERRFFQSVLLGMALFFLLLLWGFPQTMATGSIVAHPLKGFWSVEKGSLYPLFVAYELGAVLISMLLFSLKILGDGALRRRYRFILIGFGCWLLNGLFDALAALKLFEAVTAPWFGPIAMVAAIGIHLGLWMEENNRTIKKQMEENQILRYKLKFDPLTDLYSREFFNTILEIESEGWGRNQQEHSILFIDADNFKGINDRYGHSAGDEVLKLIGSIVRDNVRRSDIPSRYGGDEFIILLKECSEDAAKRLAEKMIGEYAASLKRLFADIPDGFSGLSIGIASTVLWRDGEADLIAAADEAMYRSKRLGKNCVIVAEAG